MDKNLQKKIHSFVNEAASFAGDDQTRSVIVIVATQTGGENGAGMIAGCIGGTINNLAASLASMMKENSHFAEAVEDAFLHHKFSKK